MDIPRELPSLFQDLSFSPEAMHYAVYGGETKFSDLSESNSKAPCKHLTCSQNVRTQKGESDLRLPVRRRLIFDQKGEIKQVEPEERVTILQVVLILGGAGVIFYAVVKPIIERLGATLKKKAGVK